MLHGGRGGSGWRVACSCLQMESRSQGTRSHTLLFPQLEQQTIEGVVRQGVARLCVSLLKKQLYESRIEGLKIQEYTDSLKYVLVSLLAYVPLLTTTTKQLFFY